MCLEDVWRKDPKGDIKAPNIGDHIPNIKYIRQPKPAHENVKTANH
jgi:hypothetical protein